MGHLADVLDAANPALVQEWTKRLAGLSDVPPTSDTGLRDHIPDLLREVTAALRIGVIPTESETARAHGVQRRELGFDIEVLVKEYGLLRDVLFDWLDERGIPLQRSDDRVITGLMTLACAQGVNAYVRREAGLRERVEASALASTTAVRAEAESDRLASLAASEVQQAQLQEVLDALPVLVSFVTSEERYAFVNKAYEAWFGLARENVVGRKVVEVVGDAAYALLEPSIRRGLAGERFDFEKHDVPYSRGGTRDVRVSFIPLRAASGGVSGYVALLADITAARRLANERERLFRAERESHGRTEFLLSVAAAIGERLDPDAVLRRLVEAIMPARGNAASVWACRPDGAPFRQVFAPFHPALAAESPPSASAPMAHVLATGQTLLIRDYENWARNEALPEVLGIGRAVGVGAALFVPIRRATGPVAVLAISRPDADTFSDDDVELFETTARLAGIALENARLFEETARLRATAEEATAAKDDFLARVSHDLRNPLGSILGWSTLLRKSTNATQIARGIEVIERNAKAQVQLIEDLLDISRIASGKLTLELAREDIRIAVDTALDPARLAAQAKRVTLEADVAEDVGTATVDPNRFRQILWNLASNAVKFTPSGGLVRITVANVESTLRVVVTDTGCGIAPEYLPRIFDRFEQVSSDTHRSGGLGLGLAIVRHLVELHGGTITVASTLGGGTVFTVALPLRSSRSEAPASAGVRVDRLHGARVLVVDDQADLRELVSVLLASAGASVVAAASADEAMSTILRQPPDAIVSDIGMPIKDGRVLVREIRRLPEDRGGRIPAIALTALGHAKDRVDALAAGFDEHLTKPVDGNRLIDVVDQLLQRSKAS